MIDPQAIARYYGGQVSGGQALIPAIGHSAEDRGVAIKADASAPDGCLVHCFNGGDALAEKDRLRADGFLPEFVPNGKGFEKAKRGFWELADGTDLSRPAKTPNKAAKVVAKAKLKTVASFEYATADGEVIYRTKRLEPENWSGEKKPPKEFRAERLENGRWISGLGEIERAPYRLADIVEARKWGESVYFVEGEAKADKLAGMGLKATAIPFGANGWRAEYAAHFAGSKVVFLPDNDEPGKDFARKVYNDLKGVADGFSIVELPGLPKSGDVIDWAGTIDDLVRLTSDATLPDWLEKAEPEFDGGEGPLLQESAAFCKARTPADYLIDGSVRDGWLYTLTAPTGHGKSAVALAIAYATARGGDLGSREIKQGRVLFLAGENPDDIRERWIAMCERCADDPSDLAVTFMPGVCDLKSSLPMLRDRFEENPLRLVIVDTLAAFFDGDSENDNAQQQEFATSVLRPLTELPGRPAVIVPAHPTKGAGKDNLTPKGGSSLLNAIDGNLCAWNTDGTVKVHWQGKFRGAPWSPMHFELSEHQSEKLRDSRGRIMPTVVARAMKDDEISTATAQGAKVENQVLKLLSDGKSVREIAEDVVAEGKRGISRSRVSRVIKGLAEQRWIKKHGRKWTPTSQGFAVLEQAGETCDADA